MWCAWPVVRECRKLAFSSVSFCRRAKSNNGGDMDYPFRDRGEAGRVLAEELRAYAGRDDVIVLALPRGGVPVGFEVARALHAPLDVFVVRKLGVPGHEELAMGAIGGD
jgi:hypothetical protein